MRHLGIAVLLGVAAVVFFGAQTAPITIIPNPLRTIPMDADGGIPTVRAIQVSVDGGTPATFLLGAGGQLLKATDGDQTGLFVRLDDQTITTLTKGLTDGCALGLQVSGITVPDQAIDNVAEAVPRLPDAGNPADDTTLVDIFVQNVTQGGAKNLRCAHQALGSGVDATCATGTRITPDSAVLFPVRYPDQLSCVCCSVGAATNGCTAASVVRVCVQPIP